MSLSAASRESYNTRVRPALVRAYNSCRALKQDLRRGEVKELLRRVHMMLNQGNTEAAIDLVERFVDFRCAGQVSAAKHLARCGLGG
jgi:hypothetical protein